MARTASFTVTVNLDQVPGWGHHPEDFQRTIQHYLDEVVGHYNPTVTLNKWDFRNLPCVDRTWAVCGRIITPDSDGGGVLEWCDDMFDAGIMMERMSHYSEFSELEVVNIKR